MQILEQLASGYNDNITSESIMLECASIQGYIKCMNEVMETSDILLEGAGFDKFKEFIKKIIKKIKDLLKKIIGFFKPKSYFSSSFGTIDKDELEKIIQDVSYTGIDAKTINNGFFETSTLFLSTVSDISDILEDITFGTRKSYTNDDNKTRTSLSEVLYKIEQLQLPQLVECFKSNTSHVTDYKFSNYLEFENYFINICAIDDINAGIKCNAYNDIKRNITSSMDTLNRKIEDVEREVLRNHENKDEIYSMIITSLAKTNDIIAKLSECLISFKLYVDSEFENVSLFVKTVNRTIASSANKK